MFSGQNRLSARVIVRSFVDGDRMGWVRTRETEDDAMAHALWLSKHKGVAEADEYLEDYVLRCSAHLTKH